MPILETFKTAATTTVKNFAYTGNVQSITIPTAGTYKLEVWGAQGGGPYAGKGAYSISNYTFKQGTSIKILVGGAGTVGGNYGHGGSGGGGSFIATSNNTPICVAGGGGGYSGFNPTTTIPTYTHGQSSRLGGRVPLAKGNMREGYGGACNYGNNAGDGGGFYGNGNSAYQGGIGYAFINGGSGGTVGARGGFGGGGSTDYTGAGGGGYTGGDGATGNQTPYYGGGGGSFYTGTGSYAKGGWESMPAPGGGNETGHSGNGYARITLVE